MIGWDAVTRDRSPRLTGTHVLLALYLLALAALFRPVVHGWDGAAYYSWLRSAVIEGNLDTRNEIDHFEALQQVEVQSRPWVDDAGVSVTGLWINHYPVGSAILWSPFFLAGHGIALSGAGGQSAADGYSQPYVWPTLFGTTLWGLVGILLMYGVGRQIFGDFASALAAALAMLASPLVFYMFVSPAMAHANEVFANSFFVWLWFTTRSARDGKQWFLLGLAAGLAAAVRNQNAMLVVFPGLELAWDLLRLLRRGEARQMPPVIGNGVLLALGAFVGFLPQMLVWKAVFGAFLLVPQQVSMNVGFDWSAPHLWDALFSSRSPFVWHPVLLLGVVGLAPLFWRDRRLALMLGTNVALQAYVIGSWDTWEGGTSFGARYFVALLPAFQIGLAALVRWLRRWAPAGVLAGAGALFVAWNGLLLVQYALQLIPRGGQVSIQQMVTNQFLLAPAYLGKTAELVLSRFRR